MDSPWRSELYWLALLAFVGLFFGKVTGLYLVGTALSALAYLIRQVYHINQMALWLRTGGKIPQGGGIWEEIYYLIYRLRRRNKSRKKKLLAMLERFRTATAALPDATVVLDAKDEIDSLYLKLESVIVPMYYGHPKRFGEIMRSAITFNGSFFNTERMVEQYLMNAYSEDRPQGAASV